MAFKLKNFVYFILHIYKPFITNGLNNESALINLVNYLNFRAIYISRLFFFLFPRPCQSISCHMVPCDCESHINIVKKTIDLADWIRIRAKQMLNYLILTSK